jgi:hypothetical protein
MASFVLLWQFLVTVVYNPIESSCVYDVLSGESSMRNEPPRLAQNFQLHSQGIGINRESLFIS